MADLNGPEHLDWWARREEAYQQRPYAQAETQRILAEIRRERNESAAYEARLEERIAQGDPRAQQLLDEELTRQAYETDPALPSAKGDPAEWEAFFRHFYGQDMPANAFYQARLHDVQAAAPPDVGGLRAAYDEQPWNDLTDEASAADDEMEAWKRGIPLQELQEEYRAAAAHEKAEEYDRFGLPAELWLRSLPESAASGPYQPAEALARFQAAVGVLGLVLDPEVPAVGTQHFDHLVRGQILLAVHGGDKRQVRRLPGVLDGPAEPIRQSVNQPVPSDCFASWLRRSRLLCRAASV